MSTMVVRRPARRPEPEYPSGDVVLESPPELPPPAGRGWAGVLMALPMLTGAAAMALMYSRFGGGGALGWVTGGLFGLSAIGMLAVSLGQQSGGPNKREMIRARRAYLRHLGQQRTRVRTIIAKQRAAASYRNPDPEALWCIATGSRLWERRPADADFLQVRIGLGPQELATPIVPPASRPLEDLEPMCALALRRFITTYAVVPDLPLVMAVNGFSMVYPRGEGRAALCRAVLAQLVLFHAPDDLLVAVCAGPERQAKWEFVKWLPHALHPTKTDALGPVRLHASSVVALEALLDDVVANRPRFAVTQAQARPPGPHVVVVLDGGERAGSEHLLADAGVDGVTVIDLDGPPPRLLDPARLVLDIGPRGELTSTTYDGTTAIGTADALGPVEAEAIALQLAPLRLSAAAEAESQPLGANLELTDLLGVGDPQAYDPATAWVTRPARARLRVAIGLDPDGAPVELDLKESAQDGMGPHGLVVGATGSGKSELLRTLVLALAASHDPATLNFVLVDFKGGATFATLDRLPHTSAVITNLADELSLVDRMKDAIGGELTRRQELLRRSGNFASARDYERVRAAGAPLNPLPSLLIVCDEFSELLTAKPDFIDMFVQIGKIGRSLGVHLLLASQRVEEGRLRGLDTQLSYRIGLRTFSGVESRAVLGVPDAFHLPRSPGHGYLRFGDEPLVRFKAAYVSKVHRRAGAPAPRATPAAPVVFDYTMALQPVPATPAEPAAPQAPEDNHTDPTLLDVLVDRMHGRGTPAHQVWLPPLRESPGLDDLLPALVREPDLGITVGDAEVRGRLAAPVGIVDRPAEQRRDLLLLDLSGAAGHVLVVGGPQSGKSTLLRTLVLSFAVTHTAEEVQFYCLDFGVGALTLLRDLPHVGGVATRRDPGPVRRTVAELTGLLRQREAAFAAAGVDSMASYRRLRAEGRFGDDPYGDVFLVIDGWSTIRAEFDDQEAAIVDLANRGLSFGIHVVATAGRWLDVRHTVRDVFGTRLELRLGDPTDSMVNRRVAVNVPENAPGRGLTPDGAHFLAALPRFEGHGDGTESLVRVVADLRTAWDGPLAPRVRLLPRMVPPDTLPATRDGASVPIGIAEADLRPVHVDFAADAHFLVFGDAECGKSTFLRDLAHRLMARYTPAEARLVVIDHRRSLLGVVPESHRAGYGTSADSTGAIAREVAKAMRARVPGPDLTPEQLRDRTWWTGPEVFVLVDDYDLVTATSPNPLAPLAEFLPLGRDIGLHLVLARRSGGASRAMFEQVVQRLKELGTPGLVMSGSRDEGVLLGTVKGSPLPPGRAWLVNRRAGARLVQLANRQ